MAVLPLPQIPGLAVDQTSRNSTTTLQAPYGPPCLGEWVQEQDPNPVWSEIAAVHHAKRLNVCTDGQEYPANVGNNFLHPHFCLNANDRSLAWHKGVGDIKDAVSQHSLAIDFRFIEHNVR